MLGSTLKFKGDPVLNKIAKRVKGPADTNIHALIQHMIRICEEGNGIGLAAPQVGVLLQLLIFKDNGKYYDIINPKIHSFEDEFESIEGCLSFPGELYRVKRFKQIEVGYHNKTGKHARQFFHGMPAIILQHEFQHLQGITLATSGTLLNKEIK